MENLFMQGTAASFFGLCSDFLLYMEGSWAFWFGTAVFLGTYILIASEKVHKTTAALVGAALMMLVVLPGPGRDAGSSRESAVVRSTALSQQTEVLPDIAVDRLTRSVDEVMPGDTADIRDIYEQAADYEKLDVFSRYSNFDVIFTLAGMMILVNILSGTGLFQYVAIRCAKLAKGSPVRTMVLLVFATAFLSAFLDNVTTILLVAPVTLVVASQLGVPVLPFLMAETMASNIGGTATLIGDPPNLIIGSVANLDFMAFLVNLAPFILGILIIYCIVLACFYSRRMQVTVEKRAGVMELDETAAIADRYNLKRGGIVMLLTICGFLLHGAVGLQPCVVAMSGAAAALLVCRVNVDQALEKVEWSTLAFFMALFILVSGAQEVGLMTKIGSVLGFFGSMHPLTAVLIIMWICALAAGVMNNVSFTAAMVYVIADFIAATPAFAGAENLELQHLLWWGLALSVCLGGNATLVGAAANLVTAGIAEKAGKKVAFGTFIKYGMPVTLLSMVAASGYIVVRYMIFCR